MSGYPSCYAKCIARRYLLRNILDGMSNTYSSPGLLNHKFHHMSSVCGNGNQMHFSFFVSPSCWYAWWSWEGMKERWLDEWSAYVSIFATLEYFSRSLYCRLRLSGRALCIVQYVYRGGNAYIINNSRQMQESYGKEETVAIMWPLSGYYELVLIQLLG